MGYFLTCLVMFFSSNSNYNNDLMANLVQCKAGKFSGASREFSREICEPSERSLVDSGVRPAGNLLRAMAYSPDSILDKG
jgi:hypothetical protein